MVAFKQGQGFAAIRGFCHIDVTKSLQSQGDDLAAGRIVVRKEDSHNFPRFRLIEMRELSLYCIQV